MKRARLIKRHAPTCGYGPCTCHPTRPIDAYDHVRGCDVCTDVEALDNRCSCPLVPR